MEVCAPLGKRSKELHVCRIAGSSRQRKKAAISASCSSIQDWDAEITDQSVMTRE